MSTFNKLFSTHPIGGTVSYKVSWFATSVAYIVLRKRHTRGIRSTSLDVSVTKKERRCYFQHNNMIVSTELKRELFT